MNATRRQSFGRRLRTLREARGLSLSAVARELNMSVVYYRDVERGTRRPFSSVAVDFEALAQLLGTASGDLQHAAAEERGQLEFDFRGVDLDAQKLAVRFAACLSKRRLAKAALNQLRTVLDRVG
ncbi:MAG TPA: helix-turn-helix transcriptional regulator [Vicinamibacterales bacterium]|nr:helix-turn-helix transcriptional regulator [Vicinamibacterales bacterium]